MNSGGKGAGGGGDDVDETNVRDENKSPREDNNGEDGLSLKIPKLKGSLIHSQRSSRDATPMFSPRVGFAQRQSLLARENSIDLDSPSRSPRNMLALALQQHRSIGPVLGDVIMSSVDLDEVEVFRSGPRTDREQREHDQIIIDEEEVVFSASDLASGESIVFSAHIRPDFADEHFPVDCGGCNELEIRVKALEHQIDALRAAVDAACAARKLGSCKDKNKSWTDRIFGCDADPEEERIKLICEMEPLLKAVNFMFRKIDEVKAKCEEL